MGLDREMYYRHNVHMEKLNEWLIENHEPYTNQIEYGCDEKDNGIGCDCEEDDDYIGYYDKYDWRRVVASIKGLTREERREIRSFENVRVYVCSVCGAWGVDGDDSC